MEYEVDTYFFGKFVKTIKMTRRQMERNTKLGREYKIANDRIITEIPFHDEARVLETNKMNDPLYCLEHNC